MVDTTATRTFQANVGDVTAIDQWITEVATRWIHGEWAIFRTRVCVAEIAANVVEHGQQADAQIVVSLDHAHDGIDVEIADSGRPFDPTAFEPAPVAETIEAASIGGRGLRILQAFARDLSYRRDGNFNFVKMRIPASPA